MGGINSLMSPYEISQATCTSDVVPRRQHPCFMCHDGKKGDYFPCDHQEPAAVNIIYKKMLRDAPPPIIPAAAERLLF